MRIIDDTAYTTTAVAPEDPHVAVRWYAGPERGTHVPCDFQSVEGYGSYAFPFSAGPPSASLLVPPVWAERPSYRYALAQFVLYDGPPAGRSTADDPLGGVWGIDDIKVLLVIEGDAAAVAEELQVDLGSPPERLQEGPQWLFVAFKPPLTNGWDQLLTSSGPKPYGTAPQGALTVYPVPQAFFHVLRLVGGLGPGGITFEDCS